MTLLSERAPDDVPVRSEEGSGAAAAERRRRWEPGYTVEVQSSSSAARLRTTATGGDERVFIATPTGALPDPLPAPLVERLRRLVAAGPVIVDLSDVVLASATPVVDLARSVLGADREPGQACVVCAKPATRALLDERQVTRCVAVFGSVGDALQARCFARDGYGPGWRVDPPGPAHPGRSGPARRPYSVAVYQEPFLPVVRNGV
jgi:hypothetical protein